MVSLPEEAAIFVIKRSLNPHWPIGDFVELMGVEREGRMGCYSVRHFGQFCDGHTAWSYDLSMFAPVTEQAREMLALSECLARLVTPIELVML